MVLSVSRESSFKYGDNHVAVGNDAISRYRVLAVSNNALITFVVSKDPMSRYRVLAVSDSALITLLLVMMLYQSPYFVTEGTVLSSISDLVFIGRFSTWEVCECHH